MKCMFFLLKIYSCHYLFLHMYIKKPVSLHYLKFVLFFILISHQEILLVKFLQQFKAEPKSQ